MEQIPGSDMMLSADGIAEIAGIGGPPPFLEVEAPSDAPVGEMTEAEMLREIVRNSRESRDNTRAMLTAVEQIVSQVGEAMNSPMLGGMLKMFGRRS